MFERFFPCGVLLGHQRRCKAQLCAGARWQFQTSLQRKDLALIAQTAVGNLWNKHCFRHGNKDNLLLQLLFKNWESSIWNSPGHVSYIFVSALCNTKIYGNWSGNMKICTMKSVSYREPLQSGRGQIHVLRLDPAHWSRHLVTACHVQ